MQLKRLKIDSFRNYPAAGLLFTSRINCFIGYNGAGKTNLLDGIFYLCTGKSYFNPTDQQLIRQGESYFSLDGTFETSEQEEEHVRCVLMKGRKKVIKRNEVAYTRMVDHYGEFPVVMIAPGDMELIMGGSEERRKWLDSTISLINHEYLLQLIRYEKVLQQRNAELKKLAQEGRDERHLLEVYDQMMVPLAEHIFEARRQFIEEFVPVFNNFHRQISQENEKVGLLYQSSLHGNSLFSLFESNFRKDIILQRTSTGIHRDDLDFLIGGQPLKRFGSQGQQKTFLLSLKLAQHQFIRARKNEAPLLLLDDVCERLDDKRLSILFSLIAQPEFGQVFITDSSMQRVKGYLENGGIPASFFVVTEGRAVPA